MKYLVLLVLLGIPLGGTVAVMAQNTKIPVTIKPSKRKFPTVTPAPKGKLPQGQRIGERFHLRIWSVLRPGAPLGANQKVAFFGTLKLDKQVRWSVKREQANNYERGAGESLEISEDAAGRQGGSFDFGSFYSKPRKIEMLLGLNSLEGTQTRRRAIYMDSVDLLKEKGKTYVCKNGGGDVALYVKVEPIGYIYSPIIQRPLPTATPWYRHPHNRPR